MRKLELLSLSWNQIADIAHIEFLEPLLELKEINLSHNQLQQIETVKNTPNLDYLDLSNNPIYVIYPEAFSFINSLRVLLLDYLNF